MAKVLVVDKVSAKTKEFLRQYIDESAQVVFSEGEPAVLEAHLGSAEVLLTFTQGIPPAMLAAAGSCVYIQKLGAGTNNIDIEGASRRGIAVGNVPSTNSRSVAEMALTLVLTLYKQVLRGHNELVGDGRWLKTVLRDNNRELTGKTVGLIGLGNIGLNFVELLGGFSCRILYYDKYRLTGERERELGVAYQEIDGLLAAADVVSLHCPLTEETRHCIDRRRLALMKPTAVLINCARGSIVDEAALVEALRDGRLLGAGIDTFEREPIDNTHPLARLPNVVLSPHNGGGTLEAMEAVVKGAAANINEVLRTGTVRDAGSIVNYHLLT